MPGARPVLVRGGTSCARVERCWTRRDGGALRTSNDIDRQCARTHARRREGYQISGRPVFKCEVSGEVVGDVIGVASGQGSAYGADLRRQSVSRCTPPPPPQGGRRRKYRRTTWGRRDGSVTVTAEAINTLLPTHTHTPVKPVPTPVLSHSTLATRLPWIRAAMAQWAGPEGGDPRKSAGRICTTF